MGVKIFTYEQDSIDKIEILLILILVSSKTITANKLFRRRAFKHRADRQMIREFFPASLFKV